MISARTTYDVSCDGRSCSEALIDIEDTTEEPLEEGWTVVTRTDPGWLGIEFHLCPACQ